MRNSPFLLATSLLLSIGLGGRGHGDESGFVDLFDGKTLEGWEVRSGTATYKPKDGMIVGTTTEGSPNTFLCTKRHYSDFILEFEVLCDKELNSGVQIRSHAYEKDSTVTIRGRKRTQKKGRVYGYQVEITTARRGVAGGIYDEARRGWLDNLADKSEKARKAFKDGEWNHYRVLCQGDRIRTWVNRVPCADLRDGMTRSGFIGLQVHGVRSSAGPYKVSWRNIRLRELKPKERTREKGASGKRFTPIFNGRDLKGWAQVLDSEWTVRDGILLSRQDPAGRRQGESWLLSERSYRDFVLKVEFRITPGGNSGVFVRDPISLKERSQATDGGRPPWEAGYEVNINNDEPNYPTGSIWATAKGPPKLQKEGEWNELKIKVQGDRIWTWVNGKPAIDGATLPPRASAGAIGFQRHGGAVYRDKLIELREVEILEL